MNLRKQSRLCWLLGTIVAVSGCSYGTAERLENRPTLREHHCNELKQRITFERTPIHGLGKTSFTQRAEVLKLYEAYGCDRMAEKR